MQNVVPTITICSQYTALCSYFRCLFILTQGLDQPPVVSTSELLKLQSVDASTFIEECFEAGPEVLLNKKVVELIQTRVTQVSTDDARLRLARQIVLYLQTEVDNSKVCLYYNISETNG